MTLGIKQIHLFFLCVIVSIFFVGGDSPGGGDKAVNCLKIGKYLFFS